MEFFLGWVVFSILAGWIATTKKRSFFGFFILSLVLSPLVGIIAALVARPNIQEVEQERISTGEMKKCPYCAELIRAEAKVCRYCQRELPVPESADAVAARAAAKRAEEERAYALKPKGTCPNCDAVIALDSASCSKCGAAFGTASAWQIQPLKQ